MKRITPKPDVFICHASEDKEEVARPLAIILTMRGKHVWYDEFSLRLGDSLRRAIENGLAKSRFGVVIVSQNFFAKKWPQKELDALVQREMHSKKKIILPIWHKVDQKIVAKQSLLLADTYAISTSEGLERIADKILEIIDGRKRRNIPPQKAKDKVVDPKLVDPNFREDFEEKLELVVDSLKAKSQSHEINDLIDVIIMLFKERIDKWDVPSVKFATEELFTKLYQFSEKDGSLHELYNIFEDLFAYAYSQRKQLIGSMVEVLNLILLKSWLDLDVESGEKASKILLRLAIDFIDKDLDVVEGCAVAIDNIAGDFFEPEIFAKEILLGAYIFEKASNPRARKLLLKIVEWIRINDEEYAPDAEIETYLRDGIDYARKEQKKYGIDIEPFKKKFLKK